MKILFEESDPEKILSNIKEALGIRELSKMVDFENDGKSLLVTIKAMGTSTLTFAHKPVDQGLEYELVEEKIAFTHRIFKDEVTEKLLKGFDLRLTHGADFGIFF